MKGGVRGEMKVKRMRPTLWLAAASFLLASCSTLDVPVRLEQPAPVTVSLISINDFHGNLLPSGLSVMVRDEANGTMRQVPAGGIASLATLIRDLRAENPERTLLVAGGDLVGASPQVSGMFHDEPTVDALNQLGLVLSTVGNHEFDKGRDEILRLQNGGCFPPTADGTRGLVGVDTCMNDGRFDGARYRYLAANVIDERSGQTLFPAYAIRRIGGVNIGFIGVTLKETPAVVTPSGIVGLRFADEVSTINGLLPEIKRAGADFVVVLLHQGAATRAAAINDASCPGFNGEALRIVDALDNAVELVITGHTHQEYVCRRPDGKLVTQAGHYGRLATKVDLQVDPASGKVLGKTARTHVAASEPSRQDPAMAALVQRYAELTAVRAGVVVAQVAGPLDRRPNAAGESTLGDVIADAYLFGTAGEAYGPRAAQIALVNRGGMRADLDQGPDVTFGQLYRVHPFSNTLITIELSGAQLLRLLEQQWEQPQPPGGRMLSVSAGLSYTWNAAQPEGAPPGQGQRLVPGSLRLHGAPIVATQTYRVAVNSFLASGGDNFTVLAAGRPIQESELDLEVLTAYFSAQKRVAAPALTRIQRRN
jgi:5'-nucleotidase